MPTPIDFLTTRTSGMETSVIPSQSGNEEIHTTLMLTSRIGPAVAPDRAALAADDTAVTDMSTVGFAGALGANLFEIRNCAAIVVWCEFPNSAGSATVEIIFYDVTNIPLFVSRQMTFSALIQRKSATGDYLSVPQMVDSYGASKYRPYLRVKGTGNVDVFAHPV